MPAKMKSPLDTGAAELIARRFHALSDPTRLRILDQLRSREEASVGEIAEALGASQQNISKHLSALLAEGFVARRKQATSSIYRIANPAVLELCDSVCAGIESQLLDMGALLTD
jgi:DNA-binding transcriptional ArsR family regulator